MHHDEIAKHRQREQIIRTIAHLHNARHHIDKTFKRLRIVYEIDNNCQNAKNNCEAIRQGIEETIKMLSSSAAFIKASFASIEKPPPERGAHLSTKLTPKQRDLERSGHLHLNTLPTYTQPKKQKTVLILQFKPKIKQPKPKKDPQNIPI